MPVFGLGKQRFHPDTALAIRFLVGFGGVIGSHPIQIVLKDTATERPSLLTCRTLRFERIVITILGACPITERTLGRMRSIQAEFFACWTQVDIPLRFIAEAIRAKELGAVINIREWNIGTDVLILDSDNILFSAIFSGSICN